MFSKTNVNNNFDSINSNDESLTLNISDLSGIEDESFMINELKDSKCSNTSSESVTMQDFDSDFDVKSDRECDTLDLLARELDKNNDSGNVSRAMSNTDESPRSPAEHTGDTYSQEYIRMAQNIGPLEQNYIDRLELLREEFSRKERMMAAEINRVNNYYSESLKLKDEIIDNKVAELNAYAVDKENRERARLAEEAEIANSISMLDKLGL